MEDLLRILTKIRKHKKNMKIRFILCENLVQIVSRVIMRFYRIIFKNLMTFSKNSLFDSYIGQKIYLMACFG